MAMTARTKVMVGFLGVLLLYYFYDSGIFTKKNKGVPRPKKSVTNLSLSTSDTKTTVDDILNMAMVASIDWEGGWKDDPFYYIAPETLKAGPKKGLVDKLLGSADMGNATNMDLTGISWHGNSGYAIINGNIAKVGDKVAGYTVEKIALKYVVLGKGRQTVRLSLE